jgi:DNA helicase-2/ATP-dependent DNA helicase PcrA
LWDAVSGVGGRAGVAIGTFVAKMAVLREHTQGLNLREIVQLVLEHSGLVEHYRTEREGQDRVENLEELVNAAESFVSIEGFGREAPALTQSPASQGLDGGLASQDDAQQPADALEDTGETMSPLAAFLTHAALEAGDNQAQAGQDAVQLMTVHAAKGLEFDCVFITGMEEGLFPHENAMSDRQGLEEERRLMYVAITRARQRLYLSHSQTRMLHGQTRYNLKSRFFDELPQACLKWLTPVAPTPSLSPTPWPGTYARGTKPTAVQPSWSSGFAERGDPKGLGQQAPAPDRGTDIRAGMGVFHNKFGEGQVLAVEGAGAEARAQVRFTRHGVKWLALSVAKLTPT